jgi:hypothetical protein
MNIAFTGHRDRVTVEYALDEIRTKYRNATWIFGMDGRFDFQCQAYAVAHHIPFNAIGKGYPEIGDRNQLARDKKMIEMADLVVACFDGFRKKGGTWRMMKFAKKQGKEVFIVPCMGFFE